MEEKRRELIEYCEIVVNDRKKKSWWEKLLGWKEGGGIGSFLNRETLWRSCPPDWPASWHWSYLAHVRDNGSFSTRKRFVYRAFSFRHSSRRINTIAAKCKSVRPMSFAWIDRYEVKFFRSFEHCQSLYYLENLKVKTFYTFSYERKWIILEMKFFLCSNIANHRIYYLENLEWEKWKRFV